MLEKLLGPKIDTKPLLRELDPATFQRIVEGNYVKRIIGEAQVAARKCSFFAGNCLDEDVRNFFKNEAESINAAAKILQRYYEKMTKEVDN